MKTIYFARKDSGEFMAATSLSNIAPFMGYSADRLRRKMGGKDEIRVKTGVVYRAQLATIEGRGNIQNVYRR